MYAVYAPSIGNATVLTLFMLVICVRRLGALQPLVVHRKISKTVLNVYTKGSYRLWDDEGIKSLPLIGKPTGFLLNLAADLLRIQGPNSILPQEEFKNLMYTEILKTGKNGASRTIEQQNNIDSYVKVLEKYNPTSLPAYSSKMNGMWKLLYTDFTPAAASSGKLGPFIGDVYQNLDSNLGLVKNILKLDFLRLEGCLIAKQSVLNGNTWQIDFDRLENSVAGFQLPVTKFKTREIRCWEIVYLDNDLRVLRAKRPDAAESFLFVLRREK